MQGAGLILALLVAAMAFMIWWEIRTERLLGAFHWLTLARYPRGFPVIVGFQVLFVVCIALLTAIFSLGWP